MDLSAPIKIDLKKLAELYNPWHRCNWVYCNTPITKKEIKIAIKINDLQHPSTKVPMNLIWDISSRKQHIARIAWLVQYWNENNPVDIEFGMPTLGYGFFEIPDGNHRLIAAYYKGLSYVLANVGGEIAEIEKYIYNP